MAAAPHPKATSPISALHRVEENGETRAQTFFLFLSLTLCLPPFFCKGCSTSSPGPTGSSCSTCCASCTTSCRAPTPTRWTRTTWPCASAPPCCSWTASRWTSRRTGSRRWVAKLSRRLRLLCSRCFEALRSAALENLKRLLHAGFHLLHRLLCLFFFKVQREISSGASLVLLLRWRKSKVICSFASLYLILRR